ncbi:Phosphomannomutase [Aphelenchoides fujianensis]|nr:Phosphomannomutase [Aphelenchoides fujianensis]
MGAIADFFIRDRDAALKDPRGAARCYESAFTYNTEYEFANEYASIDVHYNGVKAMDERPNFADRPPIKTAELSFAAVIELLGCVFSVVLLVATLPFSLFFCIKFVADHERLVVFRMGKTHRVHESGTVLVLPCIDKAVRVDVRTNTLPLPQLHVITADKGIIEMDVTVFVRVNDPLLAVCTLQERDQTIRNVAYTTFYNRLVHYLVSDVTNPRTQMRMCERVRDAVNDFTKGTGVECTEVVIADVKITKPGENQTIGLFQQLMSSDVGKQLMGAIGTQAAEFLSQSADAKPPDHSQWPVFNPTADSAAPAVPPPPTAHLTNTPLDEVVAKIRQCCDPVLVSKVRKSFRIQCELNGQKHNIELDLKHGGGFCCLTPAPLNTPVDATFGLRFETLVQLIKGEVAPLSEYLGGRVAVSGSIQDAMALGHLFLRSVRARVPIGVVGGSDLPKVIEQLGDDLADLQQSFDFVFTENGLVSFQGSQSIETKLGNEKLNEVINFSLRYIADLEGINKRGTFIEYRRGMLNISPIGRNCSQAERDAFVRYDAETKVRETFVAALRERFASFGLTFSIGGQISVDCFPNGWDKTFCLQFVEGAFDEIHFFGDRTQPGGNDHEIYEHPATVGHTTTSPEHTKELVVELLGQLGK